jgi:hypothetical protein
MTPLELQTATYGLLPEIRSNQNGRPVVQIPGQLYNNFSVPNRGGDFLGASVNPWTGAPLTWLRTTVPQNLNTASMSAVLESLKRKTDAPASGSIGEWARGLSYGVRAVNGVGNG